MAETGHPEWFATCVGLRRKQRNLSIDALHAAGGPTKPVVVLAENGKLTNPRPSTLAKFDTGLGWKSGSSAQVFWEGVPPTNTGRTTYKAGDGIITVGLESVLKLLTAHKNLHAQLDETEKRDVNSSDELYSALRQLDSAVSAVAGAFVTETLERNHGLSQKVIHSTIDDLLDVPLDPDDPDYDEKLYRRWLSGKIPSLDAETIRRFARRLKSSRSR